MNAIFFSLSTRTFSILKLITREAPFTSLSTLYIAALQENRVWNYAVFHEPNLRLIRAKSERKRKYNIYVYNNNSEKFHGNPIHTWARKQGVFFLETTKCFLMKNICFPSNTSTWSDQVCRRVRFHLLCIRHTVKYK